MRALGPGAAPPLGLARARPAEPSAGRGRFRLGAHRTYSGLRPRSLVGLADDSTVAGSTHRPCARQAALRPLDSGLKLDKLTAALPGWKPRTVKEAIKDWRAAAHPAAAAHRAPVLRAAAAAAAAAHRRATALPRPRPQHERRPAPPRRGRLERPMGKPLGGGPRRGGSACRAPAADRSGSFRWMPRSRY